MEQAVFHLQPWTPAVTEAATRLIASIHAVVPELEVLFIGAAALGLPGKNDIDLDILCSVEDVPKYTQILTTVLGKPKEQKDTLTAWGFMLDGFEIDAILSDPAISHVPRQRAVFERLQADPALRAEYEQLKRACDGIPYAEYESRKKAFFADRVAAK